jgi:hypothetical protein
MRVIWEAGSVSETTGGRRYSVITWKSTLDEAYAKWSSIRKGAVHGGTQVSKEWKTAQGYLLRFRSAGEPILLRTTAPTPSFCSIWGGKKYGLDGGLELGLVKLTAKTDLTTFRDVCVDIALVRYEVAAGRYRMARRKVTCMCRCAFQRSSRSASLCIPRTLVNDNTSVRVREG